MIYQLNHHNFYNSTFKIRLQQIQNAAATNTSILTDHLYTLGYEEHFSTTARMLQSLHQAKITIKHAETWPKPLVFSGTTINYTLQQLKSAYKIKTKLNKLEIYAIEQCTNYTHSQTLTWTHIAQTTMKIQRGRKPKWFEQIIQKTDEIIKDKSYILLTPNPYTLKAKQVNKKDWIYNTKTKSIGKISSITNQHATIHHWITTPNSTALRPCPGCNINKMQLQKTKCMSTYPTAYLGQIKVDSKHNIRYDTEELATIQFNNRVNQKFITKPANKSFIKSHQ